MREQSPECPQCRVPMEPGYMVDHGYGVVYPTAWVAGTPEWSRWHGLKLKKRAKLPVTSFRCSRCGRLDSFARQDKWPG